MRCLVLPGLDGGGELLDDFLAAMAPRFQAQALSYPRDPTLGYDELLEWVWPRLPTDEDFLLIGESFSGPIALRLAARRPPRLAGLVLCASFARAPRPPWSPLGAGALSVLAPLLPLSRLPVGAAAWVMLGRWRSPRWIARLRAVLSSLDPAVLRRRLREVGRVDASAALGDTVCPLLYLRAARDRLVSIDSWRLIERLRPDARCVELDAPHFVLQACAEAAAAEIQQWWLVEVKAKANPP